MTAARKRKAQKHPSANTATKPLKYAKEWEAEIKRRIAEVEAGKGKLVTLEEFKAEIRAKYGWE